MGINDRDHRLIGVPAERLDGGAGRAGEPAGIDHDDADITLDESEIGVVEKFAGVDAICPFGELGRLLGL